MHREVWGRVGELIYGPAPERITIGERTLTHIKLVTLAKLRRGEAFALNLTFDASTGGGRTTVWLSPNTFIQFRFDGSRRPAVNRSWTDQLMMSANSPEGLSVTNEPTDNSSEPANPPTGVITVPRPNP